MSKKIDLMELASHSKVVCQRLIEAEHDLISLFDAAMAEFTPEELFEYGVVSSLLAACIANLDRRLHQLEQISK